MLQDCLEIDLRSLLDLIYQYRLVHLEDSLEIHSIYININYHIYNHFVSVEIL